MDPPAAVVDYDPAWPTLFEEIRSRVEPLVADLDGWVEHVGSTSGPGLAAKPIIDIDVVVRTAAQVALAVERLAVIGYIHQGDRGIVGREAFQPPPRTPYHHLYVVVEGSKPHSDHIDLRNYLRRHPDEAQRYAGRKRKIAYLLGNDRDAYLTAKSDIISEFLQRARRSPS